MGDTGSSRGPTSHVGSNANGEIYPRLVVSNIEPTEDNSKHTPSIEEDLLLAVAAQALQDLDEIFLLDSTHPDEERKRELLESWWGARAYVRSSIFEEDCKLAGIDVDVARERLEPKLQKGRAVYGRWIRTANSINLPVEEPNE